MKSKKIVTTIKGEKLPKKDARLISGVYYKIGNVKIENSGDCYLIDDKYYRSDTGYITYDYRDNQYKIYNQGSFVKGLISFDENNKPIFGNFSIKNKLSDEVQVNIEGLNYWVLNEQILLDSKIYLEDLNTGIYYDRKKLNSGRFIFPTNCDRDYKYTLPYDSRGIINERKKLFDTLFEEKKINPSIEKYSKYLQDLTFGLEFETNKGNIPERICKKLGLMALRDGSIEGLEFVTIPMQEKNGLQAVLESLKQLQKRTTYDDSCSLHLHIGNIPRTEEFILALFKILCFIQDDIYELFPLYKKYNFGYKKKHYTKPFPLKETLLLMDNKITKDNIKENFNILFEYVSMGIPYSNYNNDLNKVKFHPSDPNGTSKWQIRSRYVSYNLIPLIFGNKETVEFRLHTPTFDVNKVMNYIFLCSSIVNYVKKNQDNILKDSKFLINISLNNILYDLNIDITLIDHLSNYIAERKNFVYNQNRESKIHFQEDEFICNGKLIDWEDKPNKFFNPYKTKVSPFDRMNYHHRDVGNVINDQIIRHPPPIYNENGIMFEEGGDNLNLVYNDPNDFIEDEDFNLVGNDELPDLDNNDENGFE